MEALSVKALLDTHALIWIAENDSRLSPRALDCIQNCARNELGIADVSLLEIAMLWHKGRIPSKHPLAKTLELAEMNFNVLRINASIAASAYTLPLDQSDPFDRIIVATARHHQLPLITKDRLITESGCVEVIW
ncbi:type II toxin-antitoxin system VapC family toxin [Coraliomargarita parva]|uniref:type II toxin-antitoxin system VapC family toxin n=1 Tax=Coraliomargarita parva TaxID=3014050 RepID=UPI0022B5D8A5|nr:type II toxin-antitoxin system VapC family toxin [Coraliomargarita parva]